MQKCALERALADQLVIQCQLVQEQIGIHNDSGMFQFPPEGTLVEIAFTGGRPDKPFVRQTVPEGTSLPDIQPGEQLQQQRAEVSQRVTQVGN
jgi:hypothetical protein